MVDGSGAIAQEYGDVAVQVDGMDIEGETLKVVIPGEADYIPTVAATGGEPTAERAAQERAGDRERQVAALAGTFYMELDDWLEDEFANGRPMSAIVRAFAFKLAELAI
jgi:hypothetical protein